MKHVYITVPLKVVVDMLGISKRYTSICSDIAHRSTTAFDGNLYCRLPYFRHDGFHQESDQYRKAETFFFKINV